MNGIPPGGHSSSADLERLEAAVHGPKEGLPTVEAELLDCLAREPSNVTVVRLLGTVCARADRLGDAEKHLARAVELAPDSSAARWMLAAAQFQRGAWEMALFHANRLLEQEPERIDYLNMKAYCLLNLGEYDAAISSYESFVLQRNAPEEWMYYGNALKAVGRVQDAVTAYRKAAALRPDFGQAFWCLADLKTFRFDAAETEHMKQIVHTPGLQPRSRAQIHFALGKALEDAKQYGLSFDCYSRGNACWREQVGHDPDAVTDFVRRSKALFAPSFFDDRAGWGASAPDPIFVVGLPRSGSTLIEQILASHSLVEGTRELPTLDSIAVAMEGGNGPGATPYPDALRGAGPDALRSAGEEYIRRTRAHRKTDRPFFIDKMPGNFFHVGLIHLILPNAKIIDARRHPLGSGFAVFKQYFPYGQSFAFDLTEIGRYYRDYVELMTHFDSVLPGRVHRVFYEQMVSDPEHEIRRLLGFCGLGFEQQCLRFYETDRAVFTASAQQVRRPIFKEAVELWQCYEPWLGPLKAALGDVLSCYPSVPTFTAEGAARKAAWQISSGPIRATFGQAASPTLHIRRGKPFSQH